MTSDEFLRLVAQKADITIVDTNMFMNAFTEAFQECVSTRQSFVINNIGALEFSKVKERKSSKLLGSKMLPETERAYFHLSKNLKSLLKKA